jgi:hypothetical protein
MKSRALPLRPACLVNSLLVLPCTSTGEVAPGRILPLTHSTGGNETADKLEMGKRKRVEIAKTNKR